MQATASAKIEHDNLPVVFALQRMIDTLSLLISQTPDITTVNQHIPFGANPQLCLATNGQNIVGLDNCSTGASINWTYSRDSGTIKNVASGLCVSTQGTSTAGPLEHRTG
jgi:hypothetical protein